MYVQSVLWGINAFDQWGVELGKQIATSLLPAVAASVEVPVGDPVTQALLAEIRRKALTLIGSQASIAAKVAGQASGGGRVMTPERPLDMFAHHSRLILAPGLQRGDH